MSVLSLKAHFDGERMLLDEPCDLLPNTPLLVTVLSEDLEAERKAWLELSASGLAGAYGPDEPEYSEADIKSEGGRRHLGAPSPG